MLILKALVPCDREVAAHELDKHIGRDVLRRKDSLGTSIRVCSEKVQGATLGSGAVLGRASFDMQPVGRSSIK